jgi:hypothetical protein
MLKSNGIYLLVAYRHSVEDTLGLKYEKKWHSTSDKAGEVDTVLTKSIDS